MRGQPLPEHFGTKGPLAAWADWQPMGMVVDVLGYLSVLAYAVYTLRAYRVYARYLNDNFSDTEQLRFRWLRNVLVAAVVGVAVTLVLGLVNSFLTPLNYVQTWYDYLFTGLLIYYLSISGLLTGYRLSALRFQLVVGLAAAQSSLPPDLPAEAASVRLVAETRDIADKPHSGEGQKDVALAPETAATTVSEVLPVASAELEPDAGVVRWISRLLAHMHTARPYLEPELTLGELATQLRTNTSWLSKVINTGCGQNFNDFINEYRVREAERRLRDPQFRHYTLLAVALEAGFNSKSTLNRVFKKLRGVTPSEAARQV